MGDDDSWMPSGQKGLSDKIDAAKSEAQKKKLKSDGLKGNDVLASAGMADEEPVSPNDDPTDIGDLNLVQLAAKFDGLGGGSVLSSVGIQGGAKAPEDPTSDDFGELALVQVMGDDDSWMPSGQKGLSDKIDAAKSEAQKKKLK